MNYLIKGHNANLKVDYALHDRIGADGEEKDAFRLQAQFLY